MNLLVWTLAVPLVTAAIGGLRRPAQVQGSGHGRAACSLTFGLCSRRRGNSSTARFPRPSATRCGSTGCRRSCWCCAASSVCLSGAYGVGYLRRNEARGLVTPRMRREFYGLIPAYVFAMLLVVGVEQSRHPVDRRRADDAGVGVSRDVSRPGHVARSGVEVPDAGQPRPRLRPAGHGVVVRRRARDTLGEGMSALNWTRFMEVAPQLHPFTLRLGVVFALIGYGTKAGLAPMHTWKPDAYREAPSPAGVLMAVGMLNGALYCVLRIHLISKAALGPGVLGRPAADARPAVRAHRDAIHPDPVEPEAAAGVFEHRARRHHGGRNRSRWRGRRRSGRCCT